jgi:hypothetical protein
MEPMTSERLYWGTRLLSPLNETGRQFHVNGITVTRQTGNVESAGSGAVFPVAFSVGRTKFRYTIRGRTTGGAP